MKGNGLPRAEVPAAFDAGAAAYDRLVGLNPGYHRDLRLSARRLIRPGHQGLRILDAGCGTGASTAALLAIAPDARVTAIDASGAMLAHARAKPWPSTVEFRHTPVEELAGVAGPFDAVLAAYLLRNVDDPDATLRALRGVLRPGGQLRFWEHVRSRDPLFAGFQRAADLVWPHLMGGCHVQRDPLSSIRELFTVESCRGFRFPVFSVLWPPVPRILGTARKAGPAG